MAGQITTRITELNRVLLRDAIGSIILEEAALQQQLATSAGASTDPYRLRVLTGRTNPIAEWIDAPATGSASSFPIVNVTFVKQDFDKAKSNAVKDRRGAAVFYVDCFGYGKTQAAAGGQIPGELSA